MPPKDLYSASMAAGKAAGKYSSTLADISGVGDEMSFIQREAAMNLQQQGQLFGAIGAGMELTSTVYGGWRDKQKFAGKVEAMEGKYGKMQEDKRGFAEKLFGAEKTYTFGEGEDAKTFSRAGVGATGGALLGELSMFDEATRPRRKGKKARNVLKETVDDYTKTTTWENLGESQRKDFLGRYPKATEADLFSYIDEVGYLE